MREEVNLLCKDFNSRLAEIVLTAVLCSYYVGLVPIFYTEVSLNKLTTEAAGLHHAGDRPKIILSSLFRPTTTSTSLGRSSTRRWCSQTRFPRSPGSFCHRDTCKSCTSARPYWAVTNYCSLTCRSQTIPTMKKRPGAKSEFVSSCGLKVVKE